MPKPFANIEERRAYFRSWYRKPKNHARTLRKVREYKMGRGLLRKVRVNTCIWCDQKMLPKSRYFCDACSLKFKKFCNDEFFKFWSNGPNVWSEAYSDLGGKEHTFYRYHPDLRKRDQFHGDCLAALMLCPTTVMEELKTYEGCNTMLEYWSLRAMRYRPILARKVECEQMHNVRTHYIPTSVSRKAKIDRDFYYLDSFRKYRYGF